MDVLSGQRPCVLAKSYHKSTAIGAVRCLNMYETFLPDLSAHNSRMNECAGSATE